MPGSTLSAACRGGTAALAMLAMLAMLLVLASLPIGPGLAPAAEQLSTARQPAAAEQPATTETPPPPAASASHGPGVLAEACREGGNGCEVCRRADDGQLNCSLPGIACQPGAWRCTDGPMQPGIQIPQR